MNQIISSHNAKIQADHSKTLRDTNQHGREQSIIYRAKITREDTGATKPSTSLSGSPFKARWYGHINNIRNYDPNDGSYGKQISRYVADLNSRKIPSTITWSIINRALTYNPVTKSCRLSLLEKFLIMFKFSTATLNVKSEFFSSIFIGPGESFISSPLSNHFE